MDKVGSAKMLRGSFAALHAESNVPRTQTPIFLHRSLLDTIPHTLHRLLQQLFQLFYRHRFSI